MFSTACATSPSKQYLTSALIASRTLVSGGLPRATTRMAISLSVIMPTRRSFSPTGKAPTLESAIIYATSQMLCSGLATRTPRVIV